MDSGCNGSPAGRILLVNKPFIIRFFHWNADEAKTRALSIRELGYRVDDAPMERDTFKALQKNPPDAVVIDLSRLPSQGRDIGLGVRLYKATRFIPIVFVGGLPEKKRMVAGHIPDAVYTEWPDIADALNQALSHPPQDPVVPRSMLDGYSNAPLSKKLGIRSGQTVALIGAPGHFSTMIGKIPRIRITRDIRSLHDPAILFVRELRSLSDFLFQDLPALKAQRLWIIWPKKGSGAESDLTQKEVRRSGLSAGLVDYKVCSIDDTWSGLLFTRRKKKDIHP